jgi:hypothetical protein
VYKHSSEQNIDQFIAGTCDPLRELSLLSHEFGHYSLKNVGPTQRASLEDCLREFQIEFEAWDEGRRILSSLVPAKFDWSIFDEERKNSLDGYYDGFKGLFPSFLPLKPYVR